MFFNRSVSGAASTLLPGPFGAFLCLCLCPSLLAGCSARTASPGAPFRRAPAGTSQAVLLQTFPAQWGNWPSVWRVFRLRCFIQPGLQPIQPLSAAAVRNALFALSTFKIISACMGFHTSIWKIRNSHCAIPARSILFRHGMQTSLQEAFQSSCVWYFRQVIDALGQSGWRRSWRPFPTATAMSRMGGQRHQPLPDLNGFWLGASLKISPIEQVQALARIFGGGSRYSGQEVAIVKDMMLAGRETDGWAIYGKTGAGPEDEAWFTRFAQGGSQTLYFAFFLNGACAGASPPAARQRTLRSARAGTGSPA